MIFSPSGQGIDFKIIADKVAQTQEIENLVVSRLFRKMGLHYEMDIFKEEKNLVLLKPCLRELDFYHRIW